MLLLVLVVVEEHSLSSQDCKDNTAKALGSESP
jgi:hypothetical protein